MNLPLRGATLALTLTLSAAATFSLATHTFPATTPAAAADTAARTHTSFDQDLSQGPAPRIALIRGTHVDFGTGDWRLVRPNGTGLTLPRGTWAGWAAVGRGAIGMFGTEAGPELQRVNARGHVDTSFIAHYGVATTPDHSIVGWLADEGRPQVVEDGGRRTFHLPAVPGAVSIVAIGGPGTCNRKVPEGGGCSVYVNTETGASVSTSRGLVDPVAGVRKLSDVSAQGRMIGRLTGQKAGCQGLATSSGDAVWTKCGYHLDSFSPSGKLVLATHGQHYTSPTEVDLVGLDGTVAASFPFTAGPDHQLFGLTWEDATHVLAVVYGHGRWSVVRLGADGSAERAASLAGQADFSPFVLPIS